MALILLQLQKPSRHHALWQTLSLEFAESAKATICPSVVNILRNSKPEATQNITQQQLAAVQTLQQDPTVTVMPADKGKAVVVMDTVEYREKVHILLSDEDTYTKITDKRRNPTSWVEKDRNNLLSEIKSCSSTHDQNFQFHVLASI